MTHGPETISQERVVPVRTDNIDLRKKYHGYRLEASSFWASFPTELPSMHNLNDVLEAETLRARGEWSSQRFFRLHVTSPDNRFTDILYITEDEFRTYTDSGDDRTSHAAKVLRFAITDFHQHLALEHSGEKKKQLEREEDDVVSTYAAQEADTELNLEATEEPEESLDTETDDDTDDLSTRKRAYSGIANTEGYYSRSIISRVFGDSFEQGLLTQWEKTKYIRQALHSPHLMERYDALNIITATNIRLVTRIAFKFYPQKLERLDMIQEGNLGMIRGLYKFDPSLGNRFSTYATWWIRQGVGRSLHEQDRTVRLPVHMSESLNQLRRAVAEMNRTNRDSDRFYDLEDYSTQMAIAEKYGIPLWKIQKVVRAFRNSNTLSIDQPMNSDEPESGKLQNVLDSGERTDEAGESSNDEGALRSTILSFFADLERLYAKNGNLLKNVNDEYRLYIWKMFALRYGWETGEPMTLEQVGNVYKLTRERVRQVLEPVERALRDYLRASGYAFRVFEEEPEDDTPIGELTLGTEKKKRRGKKKTS